MAQALTIQEVAERTNMSSHTLRYYERIGLLDAPSRAASGHRRYHEEDLEWLTLLKRLRATGMPIREMQRYTDLVRQGEESVTARRELLEAHQRALIAQHREIDATLAVLERKLSVYRTLEAQGSAERGGKRAAILLDCT
ncbi:MAG: Transcriptional regulator, MerR family [uncultured Truepera sp.]|uniref:Transcriptional regulator, MerR family n=1 Tax=uncultured Truepera sp. TaxID=543023 RepID=A0A6J4UQV8_9DEIN|nr:MAG: Transcriptional regulator, MerR family [uncultured Truepera sp.]